MATSPPNENRLIAELNDLLQLDHDAVEAYTIAIDLAREPRYREALVEHRADHKRHIEELATLIRGRGALPIEIPHTTAPLKLTVQALGAAPGDKTLLLAFKAVEGQARDKYRRFAVKPYPEDVADVVKRAAADEERHYQWVEQSLRELGVGAGTVPHAIASAVEGLHKLLADPIEGFERKVKEQVGNLVGGLRGEGEGTGTSRADMHRDMAQGFADNVRAAADNVRRQAKDAAETVRAAARDAATGVRAGVREGMRGAAATTGASPDAASFVAALRALEETGDVESLVALHADDAEVSGPTDLQPHRGREGARAFWRMYRDSFDEIASTFTNVVAGPEGTVMLEWTSEGRARTGGRVGYAGVSVVEMRDGRIRRFRTYYDTRELEETRPASSSSTSTTSSRTATDDSATSAAGGTVSGVDAPVDDAGTMI
jgi:ketosteroid isomerase-like protein/bacterioferritin (cytochrome b1)